MTRIAPYQMVPTRVLDEQQRADAAAAWGDAQRADIAGRWAEMHLQDAEDSLGPLLQQAQQAPDPMVDEPSMAGAFATPDVAPATQNVAEPYRPENDRPPSEFDQPERGRAVGGSFAPSQAVGGSFANAGDDWEKAPDPGPDANPIARALWAGGGMIIDAGAPGRRGLRSLTAPDRDIRKPLSEDEMGVALALTGEPLAGAGGKIAGKVAGAAADEVGRLRLDKFPEAVRDTIARAAERGDFWTQQRRNVIPDAEAEKMADELGRTVEQMVAGGTAGRAYNTEETRALRNGITGQALKVDDLKQTVEALGDQASDALKRELGQEEARLLALSRIVEGARAEAGRSFRAYLMDTRGRLLRSREPEYTSVSRVPTEAAPELGLGVQQAGFVQDPTLHRAPRDPGPVAPELGPGVRQSAYADPHDYYPPMQDVPAQTRAPGSSTPQMTEQPPLITEPVSRTGTATDLRGVTRREGSGPSKYDRASLVRVAGMLSGVPTHLFNAAGNTVMGGATLLQKEGQIGADLARVGVGRLLGKDVERQRFQAEVGPQLAGYGRGLWAGMQQVPGILAHGAPDSFLALHDTRRLDSGSKIVDAAVEMPLRALAVSDAVFRTAAFGGHAAALATRQATQEGLSGAARSQRVQEILGNISDHPGLLDSANNLAARDVFQEGRAVTDAISKFKREHTGARVAGDLVLPFYKTPYNVAAQGAGMTPAGLAGVLQAARRGETGEAVDRAVRATVGTLAMGFGLHLASNNFLTGAYPTDPGARSTLPEGWKPYSLRVPSGDGAVYVPVQALGALAVPLGVAAIVNDAQQRGIDKNDLEKGLYAGLAGIGQYMADMSALQGLNSVTKLLTQPERSAEATAESFAASFVPESGLARQVQQALGDAARDPNNPLEAFMAGVPGLSQFVQEKQTPLGQTRERGPAGPVAMVTGSRVGVERPNSVTAALKAANVGIPEPPKTVSRENVRDIPLTQADQRAYRTAAGEELSRRVQKAIANPKWAQGSPADRANFLEQQVREAREAAEARVLKAIGTDEIRRRLAARKPAA